MSANAAVRIPDVSVIVAAYNAEKTVEAAVRSALNDQAISVEVIVVDDNSSDATIERVERIEHPDLKCIALPSNGGPAIGRNRGIDVAKGRWIAVLDADDRFLPDRLFHLVAVGEKRNLDLVADDLLCEWQDIGTVTPHLGEGNVPTGLVGLDEYLRRNLLYSELPALGYLKPLFRREFLVQQQIHYRPELKIGEDFHVVLDCLAAGARFGLDPSRGYVYTRRAGSLSHRLDVSSVENMILADEQFAERHAATLSEGEKMALAGHLANLRRAAAFGMMVEQIKGRRLADFIATAAKEPSALYLFKDPVAKRFQRVFGRQGQIART